MLPPLVQGLTEYNSWAQANQAGEWVKPIQICLNKSNHPQKGTGGYSHSVENAFIWLFQKAPKIKELPYKLNGNLLTVDFLDIAPTPSPSGNLLKRISCPPIPEQKLGSPSLYKVQLVHPTIVFSLGLATVRPHSKSVH
jgi:hypothetical protein